MLSQNLAELCAAEFIYEQPVAGDTEFVFKHALTQEVAYSSLLIERRKALHERVGEAIEELAANSLDDHLADLANHYGRSSNNMKAVDYLTRAGNQIAQRSASPEAMRHFERALDILKEMPADPTRDSRELQLQLAIGYSAYAHQGEYSADAGKALARVVELAVGLGDTPQRIHALVLLGWHYVARAELRRASEVARDLYECAREMRNPEAEFSANVLMGHVATFTGEFREAEQFMRAAAASDSVSAGLRSYALVRRAHALWFLGFPHQALALAREGSRFDENAGDRYIYPTVLQWAGFTHMFCGELAQAEDLLGKSLNICTERGFPAIRALNMIFMGLVSVLRGQRQAGIEQLRRGIELISESSGLYGQVSGGFLALGLASAGRLDEALAALIPALEWAVQAGVGYQLARMNHVKGQLLESKFHFEEAENSFRTAIGIAGRQSAKSLELLASTSLARLLAKQGKRDEARTMLAEIYDWFTEGFDTADLKDAKALLDELTTPTRSQPPESQS